MKLVKTYGWALKIVGAALLVGLAIYLPLGEGQKIVVTFTGTSMIVYAVIRLWPFVKTQSNDVIKTINIIEITVDVMIGVFFIVYILAIEPTMGTMFGFIVGIYFLLRGGVHFYGVSYGKEKSDIILYSFHIFALVFGSYSVFNPYDPMLIIWWILGFSVVVGGFLIYDGGKGYKVYRYEKAVYQQSSVPKENEAEKRLPSTEEEQDQDSVVM